MKKKPDIGMWFFIIFIIGLVTALTSTSSGNIDISLPAENKEGE